MGTCIAKGKVQNKKSATGRFPAKHSKMEEYSKLVGDVRNAFNTGRTKSVDWRKEQLRAVDRMLVENEAAFISALKTDLNKPPQETIMAEIDFLRNDIIGLLREIDDWTQDTYVPKSPLTLLDTVLTHPEPYGVVLVIGAWNYPLQLATVLSSNQVRLPQQQQVQSPNFFPSISTRL